MYYVKIVICVWRSVEMTAIESKFNIKYVSEVKSSSISKSVFLTRHEYVDSSMVISCSLTQVYLFYIPMTRSSSPVASCWIKKKTLL